MSCIRARESALRFSGRLSVSLAAGPSCVRRTVADPVEVAAM